MVHSTAITAAAAALLAALPVNAGLYSKSSPVLQLDGKSYDRLIAQSNYTSIVEFYAPWCGHCKNLQPAYEKAAKSLAGLANVAAVDCDEELNKPFCQKFGVQGFPTLKIVKPGKTPGKPIVEDYNGPRNAKGIVDAVVDKIPNLVKKVEDKSLEAWLAEANDTAKAILFTDKGKTSALMKAIAIEFKGSISVAQARNTDKEKATLELFGITKVPTLLLLPGGKEAEGIVFDGELKKDAIVAFLSQAATPNTEAAAAKANSSKSKASKKAPKNKSSAKGTPAAASATEEVPEEEPTEPAQPATETENVVVEPEPAPPIALLTSETELRAECLGPRTGTCILALLPETPNDVTSKALRALSELAHKYKQHKRTIFPFYAVPLENQAYAAIKGSLESIGDTDVIAVNGRRGWWRQISRSGSLLTEKDVTEEGIEAFVDAIRLGEGAKQKIPDGLIPDEEADQAVPEGAQEPADAEETPIVAGEAKAEKPNVPEHGEL